MVRARQISETVATHNAALYPIDTVKTRLQMATTGGGIRALLKAGGGKALYAGAPPNLPILDSAAPLHPLAKYPSARPGLRRLLQAKAMSGGRQVCV